MIRFTDIAPIVGLGAAAGTRAGLTLLGVAVAGHLGWLELPTSWQFLQAPPALGVLAALVAYETFAERDDDVQELLGMVHLVLRLVSGALAVQATLPADAGSVLSWAGGGGGAAVAAGTHTVRQWLHNLLKQVKNDVADPRRWLLRLEEGGALGVLVATLLFPFLALLLVAGCAMAGVIVTGLARGWEARNRRPCPACAVSIREEAAVCFACRQVVPIARRVAL